MQNFTVFIFGLLKQTGVINWQKINADFCVKICPFLDTYEVDFLITLMISFVDMKNISERVHDKTYLDQKCCINNRIQSRMNENTNGTWGVINFSHFILLSIMLTTSFSLKLRFSSFVNSICYSFNESKTEKNSKRIK